MSNSIESGLDTSIFDSVIESGSVDSRLKLAKQLCFLLGTQDQGVGEEAVALEYVLKLVVDPVADIRQSIANHLVDSHWIHPDLMFAIVADDDEIALKFLARVRALDPWRMLAILKVGDLPRQMTIAGRADITKQCVEEIVERGKPAVVLALMRNGSATLSEMQMKQLYVRFENSPKMLDELLARPDLPLEIRLIEAKEASAKVETLLKQRRWVPREDALDMVLDTQEAAYLKVLDLASGAETEMLVAFMSGRDMLTPSLIIRAACLGNMRLVEQFLAFVASMPLKKVQALVQGRGAAGMRAVHAKSGLPASCSALLQAAADVARTARQAEEDIDACEFGCRLVETFMTGFDQADDQNRSTVLEFVHRYADEHAAALAGRLKQGVKIAA